MVYRRTEKVTCRLARRQLAIVEAALAIASEAGMAGVQIASVAERAGIGVGTLYRYFPSKNDLVAAVAVAVCEAEIRALRLAADAAPGALSALAAALASVAARALARRRLAWAVIAEPIDAEGDQVRLAYRRALAAELANRVQTAIANQLLPDQDAARSAAALVGGLLEGLVGPLAPRVNDDPVAADDAVRSLTLLLMRAVGVADAHARGLVVAIDLRDRGQTRRGPEEVGVDA